MPSMRSYMYISHSDIGQGQVFKTMPGSRDPNAPPPPYSWWTANAKNGGSYIKVRACTLNPHNSNLNHFYFSICSFLAQSTEASGEVVIKAPYTTNSKAIEVCNSFEDIAAVYDIMCRKQACEHAPYFILQPRLKNRFVST